MYIILYILYIQFIYISTSTYIYIYVYIYSRRINYKCIIATNSFICVITIFRLYNVEEKLSYVALI